MAITNVENVMVSGRRIEAPEVETRFQALVQSPLRAAILRFLCARPDESFDLEALMQTFGRMRLDVENCIRELAGFGLDYSSLRNEICSRNCATTCGMMRAAFKSLAL